MKMTFVSPNCLAFGALEQDLGRVAARDVRKICLRFTYGRLSFTESDLEY